MNERMNGADAVLHVEEIPEYLVDAAERTVTGEHQGEGKLLQPGAGDGQMEEDLLVRHDDGKHHVLGSDAFGVGGDLGLLALGGGDRRLQEQRKEDQTLHSRIITVPAGRGLPVGASAPL